MALPDRRSLLFALLYFCEGAPIGLLWWALPAYWKSQGLALDRITALTAVLVLPWSFKWLWAPLIDWSASFWPYRRWVVMAQGAMGLTLFALPFLDPQRDFPWLAAALVAHALAAATQDVSIDALCISTVGPGQRGRVNGWMQAGMLLGRALFGGGALLLISRTSLVAAVVVLVAVLWSTALIMVFWRPRKPSAAERTTMQEAAPAAAMDDGFRLADILRDRRTWIAIAFALVGGAAFESLGALLGPFLVEAGITLDSIGAFQLGPLAGALAVGALVGGRIADRFGHVRVAWCSLLVMVGLNIALGLVEAYAATEHHTLRLCVITAQYAVVGVFTASSFALFMDLSASRWKATMFSAFMGATNACEAGSTFAAGRLATSYGYAATFIIMVIPSLLGLILLPLLRRRG
jgi:MFS family permease